MSKEKRTSFDWEDPFFMDAQLSEEERMIRDTARDFCQEKLMPGIVEANRHEKFDRSLCGDPFVIRRI